MTATSEEALRAEEAMRDLYLRGVRDGVKLAVTTLQAAMADVLEGLDAATVTTEPALAADLTPLHSVKVPDDEPGIVTSLGGGATMKRPFGPVLD